MDAHAHSAISPGDDVLEARISARLQGQNGFETTVQSQDPVTIDTVAPRLGGTFPANGAQINIAQPNIVIFADDLGGAVCHGDLRSDCRLSHSRGRPALRPVKPRAPRT